MIWFLEKIPRLQKERNSINLLISEVDWLVNVKWTIEDGRLCIDCDIVIGEKTFPMRVIYPSQFPATPPIVVPRGEGLHWSSHQYGYDGELCLEWGSDTWHESIC